MNPRQLIVPGLILAAAAAALVPALAHEGHAKGSATLFDPNAPRKPSTETAGLIGLRTAEVGFGDIEEVVSLVGIVRPRPDRRIVIAAPVAGTLTEVRVQPGDSVKKGDLLAVIHSPELAQMVHEMLKTEVEYEHAQGEVVATRSSLTNLRAQIASSERQAALAEQDVERARAGGNAVGATTVSQREAAAIQARAQAESLKLGLEQQTRELQSLTRRAEATGKAAAALRNVIAIVQSAPLADPNAPDAIGPQDPADAVGVVRLRSPIDGLVTRRSAVLGQGVESGSTLAEVVDYSKVQVEAELPESLLEKLARPDADGMAVRIRRTSGSDKFIAGVVRSVAPIVDSSKRTAHLLIDADNADPNTQLLDGMFVDVAAIIRVQSHAVVVPPDAVLSDGPARYVFVKEKDHYRRREIRTGAADDRWIEVLGGLVPGDHVVVAGAHALSQVRPELAGAPESAATPAKPASDHRH